METRIYFHICTLAHWETVVKNLWNKIKSSGLLEQVSIVYVTVLGNEIKRVKELLDSEKVNIAFHSHNVSIYERACMELLREHSVDQEFKALYLHSKGITKGQWRRNVADWTALMAYYNIDQWKKCVEALDTIDACGVNLRRAGAPALQKASNKDVSKSWHFSGNFWWSKSEYLRKLPAKIGPEYLDPEMWIGIGPGKLLGFWNSGIQHYFNPYPRRIYVGQEKRNIARVG